MSRDRQCQICGDKVPYRITIDGKVKILSSRKRCLNCSPYGNQGRKTGIPGDASKSMKNYSNWKEEWKAVHRTKILLKSNNRKAELVKLAGGKCLKCGYSGVNRTMSFHHRDPSEKVFGISGSELNSRSWDDIIAEVRKCDLLCIRCHAEIEDELYNGCS